MRLMIGKTKTWIRLEDFESLKPIIDSIIKNKESKILIVGCGNSEFSEKIYDSGWKNLYNVDISENVISFMKERNKHRKFMKCTLLIIQMKWWM